MSDHPQRRDFEDDPHPTEDQGEEQEEGAQDEGVQDEGAQDEGAQGEGTRGEEGQDEEEQDVIAPRLSTDSSSTFRRRIDPWNDPATAIPPPPVTRRQRPRRDGEVPEHLTAAHVTNEGWRATTSLVMVPPRQPPRREDEDENVQQDEDPAPPMYPGCTDDIEIEAAPTPASDDPPTFAAATGLPAFGAFHAPEYSADPPPSIVPNSSSTIAPSAGHSSFSPPHHEDVARPPLLLPQASRDTPLGDDELEEEQEWESALIPRYGPGSRPQRPPPNPRPRDPVVVQESTLVVECKVSSPPPPPTPARRDLTGRWIRFFRPSGRTPASAAELAHTESGRYSAPPVAMGTFPHYNDSPAQRNVFDTGVKAILKGYPSPQGCRYKKRDGPTVDSGDPAVVIYVYFLICSASGHRDAQGNCLSKKCRAPTIKITITTSIIDGSIISEVAQNVDGSAAP